MSDVPPLQPLAPHVIENAVRAALQEDLGISGDVTTNATVSAEATIDASIVARIEGTIAGLDVAKTAFLMLDPKLRFQEIASDGTKVSPNSVVATISGNARAVLTAERVALNFVGLMSGIATLTAQYVAAVSNTNAKIIDTRKTFPGLRPFEKYAVRCGGGYNHRSGLFDAVLIKDNHIVAARGLDTAIKKARLAVGHMTKIEVEVDTLDQLETALKHDIDAVLLDNMSPEQLGQAVTLVGKRALTEASGGVTLETVRAIAESGVDLISVGALTHSAPVFDVGLDFTAR